MERGFSFQEIRHCFPSLRLQENTDTRLIDAYHYINLNLIITVYKQYHRIAAITMSLGTTSSTEMHYISLCIPNNNIQTVYHHV